MSLCGNVEGCELWRWFCMGFGGGSGWLTVHWVASRIGRLFQK